MSEDLNCKQPIEVLHVRRSESIQTPGAVDAEILIGNLEIEITLIPNEEGKLSTWGVVERWASAFFARKVEGLGRVGRGVLVHNIEEAIGKAWEKVQALEG